MEVSNDKTIAKNTLLLYVRMFLTSFIGLCTSRIILNSLGVIDYGIYSLVGSFVLVFVFIQGTLGNAASRFFSYEIGRGENGDLKNYFRSTFTIYFILAVLILILLEGVGPYLLFKKLDIPYDRLNATFWVFQFSSISAFLGIIQIPLVSLVIAGEKMIVYSYLSIIEAVLKVLIAVVIYYYPYDKLIMFAGLLVVSPIATVLLFHLNCRKIFKEYSPSFLWNREILKSLFSYSAWSLIGSLAFVLKTQGSNVVLNLLFGPALNAARGIAFQVNTVVMSFSQNFTLAINPQITKRYAAEEYGDMLTLLISGAKVTFFLLLIIILPILFLADLLLDVWLVDVPDYSVFFLRLMLIDTLIGSFAYVVGSAIQATGKIKLFQILIGGLNMFNIPLAYLALYITEEPCYLYYVSIALTLISLFVRVYVLNRVLKVFDVKQFLGKVYAVSLVVSTFSVLPLLALSMLEYQGWLRFFVFSIVSVCSSLVAIWLFGLSKIEKNYVLNVVRNKVTSFFGYVKMR